MQTAPGVALPCLWAAGRHASSTGQALAQTNRANTLQGVVQEHTAAVGGHSEFSKVLGFFGHAIKRCNQADRDGSQ